MDKSELLELAYDAAMNGKDVRVVTTKGEEISCTIVNVESAYDDDSGMNEACVYIENDTISTGLYESYIQSIEYTE